MSAAALLVGDGYFSWASAQQESDPESADFILLDTIIIGGEKFPRDLFSTYTSVDVVTSEELDDFTANTIGQALNRSANVRSFENGSGNSSFVIRGLNADGVTQPSRAAPIISVMVDGAPQGIEATRRGSRGVWDVEQIEVLRGPQSTLQGRDSLAGSIQVKTKDPTWEPEFFLEGIAGSNDLVSGAFAVSTPIFEDQLAIRVAGQAFKQNKGIRYTNPALASLGEEEFQEIRGKVLFTPEALPGFTGLFTVSHTHDKPAWALVSGNFFDREFTDPSTAAEFRDTKVNRYIAELTYEISPVWTAKSVTSFVDTNVKIDTPSGYSSFRDDVRDYGDLSQDIQLTYDNPDSPFSGVFGIFAGRFEGHLQSDYQTTSLAGFGIPVADIQQLDGTNLTESVAAYADVRYDIGDRLTLLGGGRVLRDVVSANYTGHVIDEGGTETAIGGCLLFGIGCPPAAVYSSLDESSSVTNTVFLPKVGLAFDVTENQTLAATVSRGYRAGFSELAIGTTNINMVDPEFMWTYELAYRSKWLDDTLQFNANAFYNDYRNQQIPVYFDPVNFPGQTITVNAAESHSYGAEFEVRWMPTTHLDLFTSIGLLKTEFDKGSAIVNGASVNLAGNEFPEAPAITASLGGTYTHNSGFFVGGDVSFTDGFYSKGALDNMANQYLDSFTVVNLQFGYESEHLKVTAFAKNLFDEQYLTGIDSTGSLATIGDGRTFGLQVNGSF